MVDGLPAHNMAVVTEYIASTQGKLTMHFLPGSAPDLNPDELVWSHAMRAGMARYPVKAENKPQPRIDAQLRAIADDKGLVRSFFRHPSVAYVSDF